MPVVPFRPIDQAQPATLPSPRPQYLLMAAALMHKEGRLVDSQYGEPDVVTPDKPAPPERYRPSDGEPGTSMMT